jgi:hypothetical protein
VLVQRGRPDERIALALVFTSALVEVPCGSIHLCKAGRERLDRSLPAWLQHLLGVQQ